MSEKEMNSYRLTSMEEPTDEMLATIMREVAEEARHKAEQTTEQLFQRLDEMIALREQEWASRIKQLRNEKADVA